MTKKTFDEETVAQTYDFLAHEKETEVRLIDPQRIKQPKSVFVRSKKQFVRTCGKYSGLYNVYAGLNERRPGGTKRGDVISVKSLVFDIDGVRDHPTQPASDVELECTFFEVERIAKESWLHGYDMPLICMSGNGYQLWYGFPVIHVTDENRDEIEQRTKLFHQLLKDRYETDLIKIDNIGDLPRVIKVIGTLSIKGKPTEDKPHRLSYCLENMIRREDPALRKYLLSLELPKPKQTRWTGDYEDVDFDYLLEDDAKLRRLFHGDVSGYPSRSEAEMALLTKLVWYGCSQEMIWDMMEFCGIGKWQESPEQYRELTYRKALQFAGERKSG